MIKVDEKKTQREVKGSLSEVQSFLSRITVVEADEGENPATWLELYTLYKLLGHKCPTQDPQNKARARVSLGSQIQRFKPLVRRVAREGMCKKDADLFKASDARKPLLKRLGISNFVPSVKARLVVTAGCQQAIDKELLRAKGCKVKDLKDHLARKKEVCEEEEGQRI